MPPDVEEYLRASYRHLLPDGVLPPTVAHHAQLHEDLRYARETWVRAATGQEHLAGLPPRQQLAKSVTWWRAGVAAQMVGAATPGRQLSLLAALLAMEGISAGVRDRRRPELRTSYLNARQRWRTAARSAGATDADSREGQASEPMLELAARSRVLQDVLAGAWVLPVRMVDGYRSEASRLVLLESPGETASTARALLQSFGGAPGVEVHAPPPGGLLPRVTGTRADLLDYRRWADVVAGALAFTAPGATRFTLPEQLYDRACELQARRGVVVGTGISAASPAQPPAVSQPPQPPQGLRWSVAAHAGRTASAPGGAARS